MVTYNPDTGPGQEDVAQELILPGGLKFLLPLFTLGLGRGQ